MCVVPPECGKLGKPHKRMDNPWSKGKPTGNQSRDTMCRGPLFEDTLQMSKCLGMGQNESHQGTAGLVHLSTYRGSILGTYF